ncbi:hypothetical protein [Burkholderia cenocepacia]|uniref:hypothetical protein n=1 Tax=Burkholderia cenocepacia TaxID=95486 RepID=UPI00192B056A|nr:hypothetical protein [Burkholderia cenocepacia]
MKYEVSLEAVWPQIATVIIEADSEEEAEEIALEMAEEGEIDWNPCDSDCIRSFEVVDVEDYEGDEEADNTEGG